MSSVKKHFAHHVWKFGIWVRGATDPKKAVRFSTLMRLCQALSEVDEYPPALARITRIEQVELLLDAAEQDLAGQQATRLLGQADISPEAVAQARAQLLALVPPQDEETRLQEEIAIHENCLTRAHFVHPFVAPLVPSLVQLLSGQVHLREGEHALEVDAG